MIGSVGVAAHFLEGTDFHAGDCEERGSVSIQPTALVIRALLKPTDREQQGTHLILSLCFKAPPHPALVTCPTSPFPMHS